MAQFDVHRNPGRNRSIPFVVVLQSRIFDDHLRRLIAPLVAVSAPSDRSRLLLSPRFVVLGQEVELEPLELQSIGRGVLGEVVASLAEDVSSTAIITAIDQVLSRAWG